MRVLVTGGFGYLGGRIVQALNDAGVQVICGSRKEQKIPDWLSQATAAKLAWDDQGSLQSICEQVDVVIHSAGMNAQDCQNNPAEAMEFNGGATARLIQASAAANVSQFIYLSTAHVYSSPLTGKITEDTCPLNRHPYAVSHRAAEDLLFHNVNNKAGMIGTVLRLSNGVGAPTQKRANCWMLAVNDFCRQIVVSGRIVINSPPDVERDFVSISMLNDSILSILNGSQLESSIINIASSKSTTLREIVELISERSKLVLGINPEVIFKSGNSVTNSSDHLSISNNKLKEIIEVDNNLKSEIDQLLIKCREWFG